VRYVNHLSERQAGALAAGVVLSPSCAAARRARDPPHTNVHVRKRCSKRCGPPQPRRSIRDCSWSRLPYARRPLVCARGRPPEIFQRLHHWHSHWGRHFVCCMCLPWLTCQRTPRPHCDTLRHSDNPWSRTQVRTAVFVLPNPKNIAHSGQSLGLKANREGSGNVLRRCCAITKRGTLHSRWVIMLSSIRRREFYNRASLKHAKRRRAYQSRSHGRTAIESGCKQVHIQHEHGYTHQNIYLKQRVHHVWPKLLWAWRRFSEHSVHTPAVSMRALAGECSCRALTKWTDGDTSTWLSRSRV